MQPENRDNGLVWDMLRFAREVQAATTGKTLDGYLADRLLRLALVQNIGEAASKVSRGFCERNPGIPWRSIIKQRHVLVHDYGIIVDKVMWRVATVHVPELIALLEQLPAPPVNPLPEPPP